MKHDSKAHCAEKRLASALPWSWRHIACVFALLVYGLCSTSQALIFTIDVAPNATPDEGQFLAVTVTLTDTEGETIPTNLEIRTFPGSALPTAIGYIFADYAESSGYSVPVQFTGQGSSWFDNGLEILDDVFQEDDEDFYIQVINPNDNNKVLAGKQIIINASDTGSTNGLSLIPGTGEVVTPPTGTDYDNSTLIVNHSGTLPDGAAWRFIGETRWRSFGDTVFNTLLIKYNATTDAPHEIEFLPVPGFTEPGTQQVLPAANQTVSYSFEYVSAGTVPSGDLRVDLYPATIQTQAVWRIRNRDELPQPTPDGIDDPQAHGVPLTLPAGNYEIYFDPVAGFEPPQPRFVRVLGGSTSVVEATYLQNDSVGGTSGLALQWLDYFSSNQTFLLNGVQGTGMVRTHIAKATGIVAASHTVLTSAQALYNPKRLAFSHKIRWTLQKQTIGTETYNPPPQTPSGIYIFNGYSDTLKPLNPGDINVAALENGVAALFFADPCSNGQFTGFQGTVDGQTQHILEGGGSKFMAGYGLSEQAIPLAQNDIDGILYASDLFTDALTNVDGTSLYETDKIKNASSVKLAGLLGSTLFVRGTKDVPTGILVGVRDVDGTGPMPAKLVFRAFDNDLMQLVHRANYSGISGNIWFNTATQSDPFEDEVSVRSGLGGGFGGEGGGGLEEGVGSLAVTLTPSSPSVTAAGANWGIDGIAGPGAYSSEEEVDDLLAGDYTILYDDATRFYTPSNGSTTVVAEQTTLTTREYAETEELEWIMSEFASGDWSNDTVVGSAANPDGDPYNNALERALDGDPEAGDSLVTVGYDSTNGLKITFTINTTATYTDDLTLTIEAGATPDGTSAANGASYEFDTGIWTENGANITVTNNGGGRFTVSDNSSGSSRFFKIYATSSNDP